MFEDISIEKVETKINIWLNNNADKIDIFFIKQFMAKRTIYPILKKDEKVKFISPKFEVSQDIMVTSIWYTNDK